MTESTLRNDNRAKNNTKHSPPRGNYNTIGYRSNVDYLWARIDNCGDWDPIYGIPVQIRFFTHCRACLWIITDPRSPTNDIWLLLTRVYDLWGLVGSNLTHPVRISFRARFRSSFSLDSARNSTKLAKAMNLRSESLKLGFYGPKRSRDHNPLQFASSRVTAARARAAPRRRATPRLRWRTTSLKICLQFKIIDHKVSTI